VHFEDSLQLAAGSFNNTPAPNGRERLLRGNGPLPERFLRRGRAVPIRDDDRIGDVPAHETPPAGEHELAAIVRKIDKPIGNHQSVASHTLHTHHLLTVRPY
jgi:hypothetical protein